MYRVSPDGSVAKESPRNAEDVGDTGLTLGQEDPLEEGMATHCNIILA